MYRLLRITRIVVTAIIFAILAGGITCSALFIPALTPWLENLQIGPAVIAHSLIILILWLIATLIFGRIYCSSICPLGTLQDLAARIPRLGKRNAERRRYYYKTPATALRYTVLAIFILCLLLGIVSIPSVLEPASAFNRICASFFRPVIALVGRALDAVGISSPSLTIFVTSTVSGSVIATMIFAVTTLIAAQSGRTLCNTVCPLGTALGCVSRFAIVQMDIDTDLCTQCRRCVDVCKASCIDLNDHTVDGSRCVVCFDCAAACPDGAMRYTWRRKQLATPMMQRISGLQRTPSASLDTSAPSTDSTATSNHTEK